MSVDVFGHQLGRSEGKRGPPGIGYKLTNDGHYDMQMKKLKNVGAPNQPNDVVNVQYVHNMKENLIDSLTNKYLAELKQHTASLDARMTALETTVVKALQKMEKKHNNPDEYLSVILDRDAKAIVANVNKALDKKQAKKQQKT